MSKHNFKDVFSWLTFKTKSSEFRSNLVFSVNITLKNYLDLLERFEPLSAITDGHLELFEVVWEFQRFSVYAVFLKL